MRRPATPRNAPLAYENIMKYIVKNIKTRKIIATVQANHSMSITDCLAVVGKNPNKFNFDNLRLIIKAK